MGLEVQFHCSWRACLNAQFANDAPFTEEGYFSGDQVKFKSIGWADSYAGTTVGTPLIVA
jgi:hypothetical protein